MHKEFTPYGRDVERGPISLEKLSVDEADLLFWEENQFSRVEIPCSYSDANCDQVVNVSDLNLINERMGHCHPALEQEDPPVDCEFEEAKPLSTQLAEKFGNERPSKRELRRTLRTLLKETLRELDRRAEVR